MADPESNKPVDDLDAFFQAAGSSNPEALKKAAQSVAASGKIYAESSAPAPNTAKKSKTAVTLKNSAAIPQKDNPPQKTATVVPNPAPSGKTKTTTAPPATESTDDFYHDGLQKYLVIDPAQSSDPAHRNSTEPFVLIPANFYRFLPWWGWGGIALSLVILVAGLLLMPIISLNRLTSRLGDSSPSDAQAAMRQLIIKGDDRTVGKLYDMASSSQTKMPARLRAVDTLSLIRAPKAEQALLRLELSHSTDTQVKEAAIAARKQRESAKTRER